MRIKLDMDPGVLGYRLRAKLLFGESMVIDLGDGDSMRKQEVEMVIEDLRAVVQELESWEPRL